MTEWGSVSKKKKKESHFLHFFRKTTIATRNSYALTVFLGDPRRYVAVQSSAPFLRASPRGVKKLLKSHTE